MKYGVLYRKTTKNIGDDMQSYAAEQWLPHTDYLVDIEAMDSFKADDDEPVATIMSAWYMWEKWNWPPSKYVYPLWIGLHYNDIQRGRPRGMPSKFEYIESGPGKEYLKRFEPIGCRDYYTQERLSERGIDNYFSGCVTLTLKKRPPKPREREYIVLVGLAKSVEEAVKKQMEGTGIDVIVEPPTRPIPSDQFMTWEQRRAEVEERLDLYQNAKCVLTFRVHCALPCIALETPVLWVRHNFNSVRLDPYKHYANTALNEDVIAGKYKDYMLNPIPNPDTYKPVRENLEKIISEFIDKAEHETRTASELYESKYTDEEIMQWRHDTMKKTLYSYHKEHHIDLREMTAMRNELAKYQKIGDIEEVRRMNREYNSKIVKFAVKFRRLLLKLLGKKP
ncbi:polysaccharide pyruvyl transferase family protein [uncultured Eubacterium sp.]|uniref:polysaccharide pyruvyl transferase family protein n=1 Tax=uncultured Eubacterium sp. TaxID=165185 RepID=UPI0028051F51|nr:polysaccharide pyruvyl transferase family protein [uncultured Eubacterium sp.]